LRYSTSQGFVGTADYTYDPIWPDNVAEWSYGTFGEHYLYNKHGKLRKSYPNINPSYCTTYKATADGHFMITCPEGCVYLTGIQPPSDKWITLWDSDGDGPSSPIVEFEYTFNSRHHIIQADRFDDQDVSYFWHGGKLQRIMFRRPDGSTKGKSTFEYDEQNRLIKSDELGETLFRTYEYY